MPSLAASRVGIRKTAELAVVDPFFDDFNRGTTTTVGNGWIYQQYPGGSGAMEIVTNRLQVTGFVPRALHIVGGGGTSGYVEGTLFAGGAAAVIGWRAKPGDAQMYGWRSGGSVVVYQQPTVGDVGLLGSDSTRAYTNGDRVRVEYEPGLFRLFKNGSLVYAGSGENSLSGAGRPYGCLGSDSGSAGDIWEDFAGGSLLASFLDDFNRSNRALNADNGWSASNIQIVSNKLQQTAGASSNYYSRYAPGSGDISFAVDDFRGTTSGNTVYCIAGTTPDITSQANDHYRFQSDSGGSYGQLFVVQSGVATQVNGAATETTTWTGGTARVTIRRVGTALQVLINGTVRYTYTLSAGQMLTGRFCGAGLLNESASETHDNVAVIGS